MNQNTEQAEMNIKVGTDRNAQKCNTILEAFQDVLEASENSQFDRSICRAEVWAQYAFDYLHRRLELSDEEIVLAAIVLEEGTDKWASLGDISKHLGCSKIEVMQRRPVLESLCDKNIVVINNNSFGFSEEVLKAFNKNEVFKANTKVFKTNEDLYMELHRIYNMTCKGEMSARTLNSTVDRMLDVNAELPFAKSVAEYRKNISEVEFRFFLAVALGWIVNNGGTAIDNVDSIFTDQSVRHKLSNELLSGKSRLISGGVLESMSNDGLGLYKNYILTEKAKMNVCPSRAIADAGSNVRSRVLSSDEIAAKVLFYNEETDRQVSDLASLLKERKMQSVLRRLRARNLRCGFTCLFYGVPGTGKTETVYQLAKMTGRDIYFVDYSQMRSKWVGESEKNVKAIFDEYRQLCESSTIKPILLLNEADALIGKRIENADRMTDKCENTIQNIVLQEMENFDGILIATTNLAGNMDNAFERRFLYKIEFEKPDTIARAKIWKSMMPSLDKKDATALSVRFPGFAGGQIENVSRKVAVDEILHGGKRKLSDIVNLCEHESMGNSKKSIGFQIG